ncbi:MAG: type II toxin-antitoxin system HipA family toxin [Proteiniphilum sp.]|jgi:serine/threonine-protein kinase HipA|uniref:type II toxin-antitoxin system HipA family toxin n=1 Tax=Proteiniphilum sp. TaxID=1926877 RepID=UPI002B21B89F|nr:type II toxin-antitoxin system HipA family toxin [Proteiniphilum sp.]MEA5129346.1 type II toxin-antitoxin system HipA family toxin [Proteiniphilum sp.]
MNTIVKVTLWGKEVAALSWDATRECGVIEFFESFVRQGLDAAPLTMPLEDLIRGERIFSFPSLNSKTFKGLPGFIADSLPDDYGNAVIDEWFASHHRDVQVTPIDRLCYIGKRGMGALEYEPASYDVVLDESSQIEITELAELAERVLNEREQFKENLQDNKKSLIDILKVGTSAGGAKPKAIIALNESTREVRSGQVKAPPGFSYWLFKFDGVEGGKIKDNPKGIGRIEYAYYKMAVDCGINMSECRLWEENDNAHFMSRRFDRTNSGEKIHMQTLCGIAHFDRDDRYSYEQLFQVMRRLYLSYPDMEQMYRRMVFNVIARNHDDHTKNHSFIMDENGIWSLAPAYDLCYAYSPSGRWINRHQLSLNGKRDDFTLDDLITTGERMDIRNPRDIIEQINEVVSCWERYAQEAKIKKEYILQIKNALRLF